MKKVIIIISVLVILCLLLGLYLGFNNYGPGDQYIKKIKGYSGICVFDVDKTLTCGDGKGAVRECVKNNYAIAICTARPIRTLYPLSLEKLGIPKNTLIKWGSWNLNEKAQAEKKATQLEELRKIYTDIPKKNIFLIDDKKINITAAIQNGFNGIHVSNCNLSADLIKSNIV